MINFSQPVFLLLALGAGFVFGFLIAWLITGGLRRMTSRALQENNQNFLQLAQENLGKFQLQAQSELEKREKAVETMVKPINDALKKTEEQIQLMEKERRQAYGSITQHLTHMAEAQQQLKSETQHLVNALRRPEVRGRWGELTLKRLVELAGMVDRCDFEEQVQVRTGNDALRPDMIIHLPDERILVVDAKTPLDSYLTAMEAGSEEARSAALVQHARNVREHIRKLAKKDYWSQFENSPEFVILFIPGDQFLSAALDQEPGLLEDALRQQVILATPTSFMALLKAVAYGWRQVALAENAAQIRDLAQDLYQRLATFTEHLDKVGRSLGSSLDAYNKAVGSLERNVLPGARKFTELGVATKKSLPELNPLEQAPRRVESANNKDD